MVGVVKYADVSTISMVVDGGGGMSTASRSRRVLSRIALTRDTCTRRVRLDTTVHCCCAAAAAAARRNIYLLQHCHLVSCLPLRLCYSFTPLMQTELRCHRLRPPIPPSAKIAVDTSPLRLIDWHSRP